MFRDGQARGQRKENKDSIDKLSSYFCLVRFTLTVLCPIVAEDCLSLLLIANYIHEILLAEPLKQIFCKSWEFGPTGLPEVRVQFVKSDVQELKSEVNFLLKVTLQTMQEPAFFSLCSRSRASMC